MEKNSKEIIELKEKIKSQEKVIEMLSNEEVVRGLNSALKDFKEGNYKVLKNY